ncbi:hypothetical protein RvY_11410 [Ramazzottius varieornatus]|uniref:Reverse transcriptase domain-containing protein n=1 Tax=Ramazzottius varieornatus TaxID=947166 RepID=A0A1D1VKD4_RAMVA|nr:hypothetical protein RvY_11410 [Ramazzottius varieornatus]
MAPPIRIFIKLVCGRIISYLPHAAHQFGFTTGKSCSEGLRTYAAAVETTLSKNNYCIAVFLDLKAVFDTVNHGALLTLLDLSMTPSPLFRIIKHLYRGTLQNFERCKARGPSVGGALHFYLSMLHLYVSAGRQAEITLGGRPGLLLLYADDIVILSISAEHAQLTINRVCEYIKTLNLSLNVPKCAVMHISKTKTRLQSPPSLFIEQTEVEKVTQIKYLGATINSSNS